MPVTMTEGTGGSSYAGYKRGGQPDGEFWLSQIRKGIEFRKKCTFEVEWETWRRYYRGEFADGTLPANLFFKMVRTLVPRVYFRNPSVSISSSLPGDQNYVFAQILERVDNKLIRKMRVKQAIKSMTQHSFLFGTGIGKLGYGAQYTLTPDVLDTSEPVGKKRDYRVEYDDRVQPNMPWFMAAHPGSFIVPVGTMNLNSARWCAHYFLRDLDDIKDDPRLKNTSDLQVSAEYKRQSELIRNQRRPHAENLVELVEIRDKKAGKAFIMAPYHNARILYHDDDDMLDRGFFPYFPLIFNEDDLWFWGVPDAKILDPQQREINEIRTLMMKHRRLSILKVLALQGSITPDEMQKLTSEEVGPVIQFLNAEGLSLAKPMDLSNIPQGLVTMDALVEKDVQEILGLGANQFGEYAPGSADRSATEAGIVNQATQIRMDERRDAVADLLVQLMDQTHDVIFNRWGGEQVIDLVGPGGVQIWLQFRPSELRNSGYNINIDPDSTLPDTKQMREQRAMMYYKLLSSNPLIDPHKLTALLVREAHDPIYEDLLMTPDQAQALAAQRQQAMQAMQGAGTAQNPARPQQLAAALPQLRAIAGGRRG